MATVFTKIIRGEIPSYKIAESDRFYAFLDIKPVQIGHTLVVPKQEIDNFFDIDDRSLGDMMIFTKRVAGRIKEVTGCKKVAMMVIGLEVPHAHIHLIPINSENDIDMHNTLHMTTDQFTEIQSLLKF